MKHIALALAVMLSLTVTASAAGTRLEVHVPDGPVGAGVAFQVTADLTGNTGFRSLQFVLTYDPEKLECTRVQSGGLIRDALFAANPTAPLGAAAAVAASEAVEGDGQAAVFSFQPKQFLDEVDIGVIECYLSAPGGADTPLDAVVIREHVSLVEPPSTAPDLPPGGTAVPSSDTAEPVRPSSDTAEPASPSSDTAEPVRPSSETAEPVRPSGGTGQNANPTASSGGAGGQGEAPAFTDTVGTWAEKEIAEAARRGLFHGYPDGSFRPNNLITRGQYVLVLWNLAGRPAPTRTAPFRDLDSLSGEFRDAVTWAWENGYVNGVAPDRFSSGGYLTRQAAMKILFGYNGGVSGTEAMLTNAYDSVYTDSGALSAWAKEGVYWAVYHNILRGVTADTLNPAGVLTRAQLAAIMIRYTDRFPAAGSI